MKETIMRLGITALTVITAVFVINWMDARQEPKMTLTEIQDYAEEKGRTGVSNYEWQQFEEGFVESCNEDGLNEKYCKCTLNYLKTNNTKESIYQMSSEVFEMTDEDALPEPMMDAIYACIDLFVE